MGHREQPDHTRDNMYVTRDTDLGVGVGEDEALGGQSVQVGGDHGHGAEAVLGLQGPHIGPEVVGDDEQHILPVRGILAQGRDNPQS